MLCGRRRLVDRHEGPYGSQFTDRFTSWVKRELNFDWMFLIDAIVLVDGTICCF